MGEQGYAPSIAYLDLKREIKARGTFVSNYRVDTYKWGNDISYVFSINDIIIFELRWEYGKKEDKPQRLL